MEVNKLLRLPKQTSESLMWLIGLYLGDGYISASNKNRDVLSIAIPASDQVTRNKLQEACKDVFNYEFEDSETEIGLEFLPHPIIELFKQLNLRGKALTKKVTEWFFLCPIVKNMLLLLAILILMGMYETIVKIQTLLLQV